MNIDDQPLHPAADSAPGPPSPEGGSRRLFVIAIVVGLLAGGIGAWWWTSGRETPAPQAVEIPPPAGTDQPPAESPPAVVLPPMSGMDAFLRSLLGPLSSRPELAAWLATDDLVRQLAAAIDRTSRGASPSRDLRVLAPQGTFTVARTARRVELAPASYQRFDGLARTVASLDPVAVAKAYQTIQPRLNEAYRGLGHPEGNVDAAVDAAFQVLLETPIVRDPIVLVEGPGASWVFADPRLQALSPAQQQLLRMGPDNVEAIQTTLHAIRGALRN